MLRTRVITALIGFAIAILAITLGGPTYNILIAILALLGWRELTRMIRHLQVKMASRWGYVFIFLLLATIGLKLYLWSLITLIVAIMTLGLLYIFSDTSITLDCVTYSAFGIFYSTGGFVALMLLRDNEFYQYVNLPIISEHMGQLVLWLLLFTTWASDTFAYFAGCAWGRHRIVPKISPNKTLEGFIGGFMGSIATGIVYTYFLSLPLITGLAIGFLVGIFAPLGDLFESKLKRTCGIKDSGVLLPGHGGVLDRFDSLLFSAPVVFIYLMQL